MRRTDDAWLARAWDDPGTRIVVVADGRVLVRDAGDGVEPAWAAPSAVSAGVRDHTFLTFLGADGAGVRYFATGPDCDTGAVFEGVSCRPSDGASGLRLAPLLDLIGELPADRAELAAYAVALDNWHRANRHCGRCGAATAVVSAGHMRRCPSCRTDHRPRTDPAVIMLVTDERDRVLLARRARAPYGRMSPPAGFVEPGETLEQAVVRELMEEVGVPVTDVTYLTSQPWPFPAGLMLAFAARAVRTDVTVDEDEIVAARWFTREELGAHVATDTLILPPPGSVAAHLVERWYGSPPTS
ncbi:NAD(+) diphosphatase [Streptomyces echinoruber]|uniref:NAD(+) diphosphatase n=1 Tax=Streptomyces echinoruber TaxID=68898 RepID=UPI001E2ABE3D|nr:NAD(+) diphosphatase [Streptomyces echinoruber]